MPQERSMVSASWRSRRHVVGHHKGQAPRCDHAQCAAGAKHPDADAINKNKHPHFSNVTRPGSHGSCSTHIYNSLQSSLIRILHSVMCSNAICSFLSPASSTGVGQRLPQRTAWDNQAPALSLSHRQPHGRCLLHLENRCHIRTRHDQLCCSCCGGLHPSGTPGGR